MLTRGILLIVLLGLGACGEPPPTARPDDTAASTTPELEVRQVLDSYYAALSARDWPRFEDHFWAGATMTTIWTPEGETADRVVFFAIPDFVAQAPEGPGSREIFEERLVLADVMVAGVLAQAWARYHARFGDPGDISEWEGMDAFTFLKHDGRWRITSLAYAPEVD